MKKIEIAILVFALTIITAAQTKTVLIERLRNDRFQTVEKTNLHGEVYKITNKLTGRSYYKNLGEYKPKDKLHKTSVVVDTTIIYPDLVDTTQFDGMYEFWTRVDVGTSAPIPIVVGDVNNNGNVELYGNRINSYLRINERSIYEYNPTIDDFEYKADLPWDDSISFYRDFTQIYDINMDSKEEIFIAGSFQFVDSLQPFKTARTFKLNDSTDLPTELDFEYKQNNQMNDPLWGEYDKREGTDLFYCGEGDDLRVAAARYDKTTNSASTVYVYLVPEDIFYLGGLSNQDIDEDGFADLVTGGLRGDIVIFEYQEDIENYKDVWYGDAGTYNVYIHFTTNDIDGNGKKEIWVGGDAIYNGVPKTRLTSFEAVGNNLYEAKHVIDIIGRMSFDAYNGFTVDIDKDGTEEIGLCLDQTFMIFKFNGSVNQWGFDLFYLKINNFEQRQSRYHGALMYDINNGGFEEVLIMSSDVFNNNKDMKVFTLLLKPTELVNIKNYKQINHKYKLYQNYPNPFNPETKIEYELPRSSFVNISVYNILGENVAVLVNEQQPPGNYEVEFVAKELSSGVYYYRLTVGSFVETKKMILLR